MRTTENIKINLQPRILQIFLTLLNVVLFYLAAKSQEIKDKLCDINNSK